MNLIVWIYYTHPQQNPSDPYDFKQIPDPLAPPKPYVFHEHPHEKSMK
jgi:hypothetical protein